MKRLPATFTISLFIAFFLLHLSCNRKETLFNILSSSQTNIDFINKLEQKKHFSILYYLYFYNGGGVATGDINNDGLTDIYFTANSRSANKLYLNKGDLVFEDITSQAGVAGSSDWCTGVTMADVNSDGFLDIYVSAVNGFGQKGHNELFISKGNGSFQESSREYGLDFAGLATQAAFFDYDEDGDLDCYLLNHSMQPHANILDTLYRREYDSIAGDRFYRNEFISEGKRSGNNKFTDVSKQAGIFQSSLGYGLGLAIADINNDGWEDIYVGNDFHENDYYYVNNGDGSFTESGAKHFNHYSRFSMGNDVADYNNDGHLDIITVDMLPPDEKVLKTYGSDENPETYKVKLEINGYQHQFSKNCLQRNNGNGESFSETALISGISATDWSWSALFADLDNDAKKDLFITSGIVKRPVDLDYIRFVSDLELRKGMSRTDKYDDEAINKMPDGSSRPFLFKGNGNLNFEDVSSSWGLTDLKGYYTGASYADLDNDGDLDIIMNPINSKALVMENKSTGRNFISLTIKDSVNTSSIGAKAWLFHDGIMQYQQLMLTRGFESSVEPRLHFGLNESTSIDSLLIVWPDESYKLIRNVETNKHHIFEKREVENDFVHANWFPRTEEILDSSITITDWRHRENEFNDYNVQYLLPHAQSTRGPKMAVADIDNDGYDDLYVCGALDQPGALLKNKNGNFLLVSDPFGADAANEDVDAVFFDANKDGLKDLYVASGGYQHPDGHQLLQDRLYINKGNGNFEKQETLPQLNKHKSCVDAADIDHDGDVDLFVGVLADPLAFGYPQSSYILINDGNGKFTVAPDEIMNLKNIGIVTAAAFADLNNDNRPDLAIVGEWMGIHVYINENGRFRKTVLPSSSGLWQAVHVTDANGDGFTDLLLGNWGHNNKFRSGKDGPARLYVADFDKNGRVEQLLSYTADGKEYPFLAKDEVERPLPLLKKHYLLYAEYAGQVMKDVFYGWIENVEPLLCERLGNAIAFGDGKGGFEIKDLPADLQLAPIFSFEKMNDNTFLAGGNFFDVIPYEGRYDAQPLAIFKVQANKNIDYIHSPGLLKVKGQVRDVKKLKSNDRSLIIAARNNDQLIGYPINKN